MATREGKDTGEFRCMRCLEIVAAINGDWIKLDDGEEGFVCGECLGGGYGNDKVQGENNRTTPKG